MTKRLPVLILLLALFQLNAQKIPELRGFVNDYADLINSRTESLITSKLKELEGSDSTQIFILTVPSLEGYDIESYSIKVAEKWKPGQNKLDNGVLFIVSKNDRRMRIEVGYGLEGVLTDLLAGRVINNIASVYFRDGKYDEGFIAVTDALIDIVRGEYQSNPKLMSDRNEQIPDEGKLFGLMIALFFMIRIFGSASRKAGAASGVVLGSAAPLVLGIFNPALIIFSALIGLGMAFIPMSFVYMLLSASMRGTSGKGGGFSGGGGGKFGGGGASGGW